MDMYSSIDRRITEQPRPDSRNISPSIVSILDILGYKEIIRDGRRSAKLFDAVCDIVDDVGGKISALVPDLTTEWSLSYRVFSDNVVVSCGYNTHPEGADQHHENLLLMCVVLSIQAEIQTRLLTEHHLLSRGGAALGRYFRNDEFVFGEALVEAYELESRGGFPRILVSEELERVFLQSLEQHAGPDRKELVPLVFDGFLRKDEDGRTFVHYLRAGMMIEDVLFNVERLSRFEEVLEAHGCGLREAVAENRKDIVSNPGTWGKYAWALAYHNRVAGKRYRDKRIDPSILYHRCGRKPPTARACSRPPR